ncbi:MAG: NfeD family protein [Coriobacteriales bacterium]|jgi:membrane protein implicated in regulation of membrane protease activity|nr:NfeD family protein [Coriobacteriales bacterium]
METLLWFLIWVVLAAALCIGEMLTVSFFMLPFAVGAAGAAIASVFGADTLIQLAVFVLVSVLALATIRPFAQRISKSDTNDNAVAGVDRLIGKQGQVVGNRTDTGEFRVSVDHDTWSAVCETDELLPIGTAIEVLKVDGVHLVVRQFAK